jgi:DNA-directed RNA polymerase, mitochondrial
MKSKAEPKEFDRSLDRVLRSEDHRRAATGFGTTKQGQRLAREYREQLAARIATDRTYGRRDKSVWRALKGMGDDALAIRLLVAGISVAEDGDLGADDDGVTNFRDQALFIGRNLGQQRLTALKVGAWGVNMLTSLPVFALDGDDGDILKMTVGADILMDEVLDRAVASNPLLSPLTTPPEPWTQVRKGGLPADHWAKVPLIIDHHASIENAARKAIRTGRMRWVLDAINALQNVAFAINEPVRDFIKADRPPVPAILEKPRPPVWQKKKFQADNQITAFHTDMVIADAMAAAGRFWVPLNIDFRGRLYGIPHFNFQREDRVRALFLFADGKPIGDEGLKWLKAHVAGTAKGNVWSGNPKPGALNARGRIEWTDANLDKLCDIGRAVLRRDDPETLAWVLPEDKDLYQFLAACVELAGAIAEGPGFITRLPLMFDASQSGLQHYCAMTRDEVGGQWVNLTPNDEQDDFYARLAQRVWDDAPDLRHLMEGPDDRDMMKKPGMSYFYGSRPGGFTKDDAGRWHVHGMTKQIIEVFKQRKKNDYAVAKQLARAIYKAIEDMAPRAKKARNFLRRIAWLYAKENKPLRWNTAYGMPVINRYHRPIMERVPVKLNGRRKRFDFVVGDEKGIWHSKAANAAPANFVHSTDACHLQMVARFAANVGIEIVCVHDCFGTVAPDAALLNYIIRTGFEYLHSAHDLLSWVLESAKRDLPPGTKLPKLPERGTLDLKRLRGSYHMFKNN